MKHGCGTRGAAPASDAAGCGDASGTPLLARPAASRCVVPCGFHVLLVDSRRLVPTRADAAPTRADSCSGLNRPYRPKQTIQAEIQKKKKGAERTVWLISKPYFSPISHKRQNISSHLSSHFVSHFTCLCALCLSASVSSPLWLWDTQPLGTHSVCCFKSCFSYYLLLLLNLVYVCIISKSMLSNILKI